MLLKKEMPFTKNTNLKYIKVSFVLIMAMKFAKHFIVNYYEYMF